MAFGPGLVPASTSCPHWTGDSLVGPADAFTLARPIRCFLLLVISSRVNSPRGLSTCLSPSRCPRKGLMQSFRRFPGSQMFRPTGPLNLSVAPAWRSPGFGRDTFSPPPPRATVGPDHPLAGPLRLRVARAPPVHLTWRSAHAHVLHGYTPPLSRPTRSRLPARGG